MIKVESSAPSNGPEKKREDEQKAREMRHYTALIDLITGL